MLNLPTKLIILVLMFMIHRFQCLNQEMPHSPNKTDVSDVEYSSSSIHWCDPSLECDDGLIQNSMCYMTKKESKGRCFFMEDVMTEENRRVLLAYHNSFRDQLASGAIPGWPPVSNMMQLSWDETLEKQATLWAFQCKHDLDPCNKNPTTPVVGQAMANSTNTEGRFLQADPMFKIMINYSSPEVTNGGTDAYGSFLDPPNAYTNFVQIAFAQQSRVGCGLIRFLQNSEVTLAVYTTLLTCFYAQETDKSNENALGYTEGRPCSHCPAPTKCNPNSSYNHLCAKPQDSPYDSYSIVFSVPQRTGEGNRHLPMALLIPSCLITYMSH